MEIRERIKTLRKSLGISQSELARRLGVTSSSISLIESGKNAVTETMLKSICFILNVNDKWLRGGSGEMFLDKTDREDELLQKFRKLSPLAQNWLIERAEEMLKSEMFSSGRAIESSSAGYPPEPPAGEGGFEGERTVG
jgi:transcriptional regulator with XRE-family HTH domain